MSKSPTPTNTHSPSRTGTPTHQQYSTGNTPPHESTPQPTHLVSSQPGSSKRRRHSTSSTETISKRARMDPEAMRSSPSVDSNDGMDDTPQMMSGQTSAVLPPAPPKKKRTRTLTTPHQAAVLHALLAQSKFPTTAMREEVGRSIGLSARKVQIWFQNQRQKMRRPKTATSNSESNTPSTSELGSRRSSYTGPARHSDPALPMSLRRRSPSHTLIQYEQDRHGYPHYPPSYHDALEPAPLQGPGVPGSSSIPRLDFREPSPRPSTSHSSYTSGYSSFEGISPTAPVFAHSLPSPTSRRDPSRTLPPLSFGARSSISSSSASLSSRFSPTVPSFDHDTARISPTNQFGLPPPFALEPSPQWDPSSLIAPLRPSPFSGGSPSSRSHSSHSSSPKTGQPDDGSSPQQQPNPEVLSHDHDSPRVGRYDPIRDEIVPASPHDEQQQRSP